MPSCPAPARAWAPSGETAHGPNYGLDSHGSELDQTFQSHRVLTGKGALSVFTHCLHKSALAFELGEFCTREWLRRISRFREIERSHELLLIQQGAAIAAYNQAVGESL